VEIRRVAIVGATGPTGRRLAAEWVGRGVAVRVVSRSADGLARAFGSLPVERVAADALDPEAMRRAADRADVVFDCIGLPPARMADHPATARNVGAALGATGARGVHVSSFWAYLPLRAETLDECHPRTGGPTWVRLRREAEDVLQDAGAAVVNLPDFYGPEVHTSVLQTALDEAAAGRRTHWIGSLDTAREHAYVPDAMRAVADLAGREAAYGRRWIVPGAGPIAPRAVLEIAGAHLGRRVRGVGAGRRMLDALSLFSRTLRELRPLVPDYVKPIRYDGTRLAGLVGAVEVTPYARAIPRTLDWLAEARRTRAAAG